jgi:hypothetical protein
MEQTPSFNKSDDAVSQRICAETSTALAQTVFSQAPKAILQPDPKESRVRPLSNDTPEDKYPDNTFNMKEIAWDFYVSATGWPPSGTLCISHTGTGDDLLQALNQCSDDPEDPIILFEAHDIQSWRLCYPAWSLAATTGLVKQRWRSHAMKEPIVLQILKDSPDFATSLQSKVIKCTLENPSQRKTTKFMPGI